MRPPTSPPQTSTRRLGRLWACLCLVPCIATTASPHAPHPSLQPASPASPHAPHGSTQLSSPSSPDLGRALQPSSLAATASPHAPHPSLHPASPASPHAPHGSTQLSSPDPRHALQPSSLATAASPHAPHRSLQPSSLTTSASPHAPHRSLQPSSPSSPTTCEQFADTIATALEASHAFNDGVPILATYNRSGLAHTDPVPSKGAVLAGTRPPLQREAPGSNLILLCVAEEGGWQEFQELLRELQLDVMDGSNASTVQAIAAEFFACLERQNGLDLPEYGEALPVLPPPVYLYAQHGALMTQNMTVFVDDNDGTATRIFEAEIGGSSTGIEYPFTERGLLLGPGHVGAHWSSSSCGFSTSVNASPTSDRAPFYHQLTLAAGAADPLLDECYTGQCAYVLQSQLLGGFTSYYNVSRGVKLHGKEFVGATFRVTLPLMVEGLDINLLVRIGMLDDKWNQWVLAEREVTPDESLTFELYLNQSEVEGCAACPRRPYDNKTVLDPCGVCPDLLFITVWEPARPISLFRTIEGIHLNRSFCLESDDPSCMPWVPPVLIGVESWVEKRHSWLVDATLITLLIVGSVMGLICIVDLAHFRLSLPHVQADLKASKHSCRTCPASLLHLCDCLALCGCLRTPRPPPSHSLRASVCLCLSLSLTACRRLCSSLLKHTIWILKILWVSAGTAPPGPFPLQALVAFFLWIPFTVIFPYRIEDFWEAIVKFFAIFHTSLPAVFNDSSVLALIVGTIILYGLVMMIASCHISWTARELAMGRPRPDSIYQWARPPSDKPPDTWCTRRAYQLAKRAAGANARRGYDRCRDAFCTRCCFCLGRTGTTCLDAMVYCPHACMMITTASLFAISATLIVAAIPTRELADQLVLPVNSTTVEEVWDAFKDILVTPEVTLQDLVDFIREHEPELADPPACIEPYEASSLDRQSVAQLLLLPVASALAITHYNSQVRDSHDQEILEDAVTRVSFALSDALAATPDKIERCRRVVYLNLVYFDLVRLFLRHSIRGVVVLATNIVRHGDRFVENTVLLLSSMEELQRVLYLLADNTEGLLAPCVCAMVAMAFSLNTWARTYGFLKGFQQHDRLPTADPDARSDSDLRHERTADGLTEPTHSVCEMPTAREVPPKLRTASKGEGEGARSGSRGATIATNITGSSITASA